VWGKPKPAPTSRQPGAKDPCLRGPWKTPGGGDRGGKQQSRIATAPPKSVLGEKGPGPGGQIESWKKEAGKLERRGQGKRSLVPEIFYIGGVFGKRMRRKKKPRKSRVRSKGFPKIKRNRKEVGGAEAGGG